MVYCGTLFRHRLQFHHLLVLTTMNLRRAPSCGVLTRFATILLVNTHAEQRVAVAITLRPFHRRVYLR